MTPFDWSVINTGLIVMGLGGMIRYLFLQARAVDSLKQVLMGFNGDRGIVHEVHELRTQLAGVSEALAALTTRLTFMDQHDARPARRP